MTTQTPASLLDRAEARWTEIGASQPDLTPAIALQRRLVTRTIQTVDRLDGADPPVVSLEPEQAADKLRAGTPAFRGEPVALPVAMLHPLVLRACDDLAAAGAGDVARRVRGCLDEGRIDVGSLLIASFDRNQNAIRIKAVHEGIAPDVLWLAAELAVGPAAYVAQRTLFAPGRRRNTLSDDRRARGVATRVLPGLRILAGVRRRSGPVPAAPLLVLRCWLAAA